MERLLNSEDVFGQSDFYRKKGTVYFLLQGEEVVYIGSTIDPAIRLRNHRLDKEFDRYMFIWCDLSEMDYTYMRNDRNEWKRSFLVMEKSRASYMGHFTRLKNKYEPTEIKES